jgi:hypothetical protein
VTQVADERGELPQDAIKWAWDGLDDRQRLVLELRLNGRTLEDITDVAGGVTRERVRQIQVKAERTLLAVIDRLLPDLRQRLDATLGEVSAVPEALIWSELGTLGGVPAAITLRSLGIGRPRTWAGDLVGWWTTRPALLDVQLRDLAAQAPFVESNWTSARKQSAYPLAYRSRRYCSRTARPSVRVQWVAGFAPVQKVATPRSCG